MTDTPFDPADPFETRLAARVRSWADQAVEPIDALAIARSAASTPLPAGLLGRLRGHAAHPGTAITRGPLGRRSSAPLVALLTLLTGLALIGSSLVFVASQRSTPSPQGIDPLDMLLTEIVAPGVHRVLADEAGHDLTTNLVFQIAAAPDGDVWLHSEEGLLQLRVPGVFPEDDSGSSSIHPAYGPQPGELLVDGDGTVWATRHFERTVTSFDGRASNDHPNPEGFESLFVPEVRIVRLPDGAVLAAWGGGDTAMPDVARFDGGAWTFEDNGGWPQALAGELGQYSSGLAVTDDGALWASTGIEFTPPRGGELLRLRGGTWDVVDAPFKPEALAAGADGTLWITSHHRFDGSPPPPLRLARFDGSEWEMWTAPEGFEPGILYWDENFLPPVIAADGSAWLRLGRDGRANWSGQRCDGVGRFDGTTWSTYLPGTCVTDVEPAADGSVWVATYSASEAGLESRWGMPMEPAIYLVRP